MAEQTINILRVGTDEAVKSVGDLRENIKALKKILNETQIDSAEGWEKYQETLEELKVNQNALKDAMYATSGSFQDVVNSASSANVEFDENNKLVNKGTHSYNSLVHAMAALKEEWRSTNDEARRNELGEQIGELNDQLKGMDASVGNFQRNVGNYSSALAGLGEGFMATAGGAGAVINPVKNVTMGFKALSATPVIGILGLLANILMKVIDNLETSEENSNRMTIALAPLKAGTTALTKVFQFLGNAIAAAAEWMTKMLDKLGWVDDAMREHQDIAKEEIALNEERRKVEMANADAMLEVAQLRAKAAEKDKYTAQERLKFIEDAALKEREIADRNIEIARREYEVLQRKSELAGNSKEENDRLAEAYVKLQNAETDYFNKTRELSAQRVEAINQIKAETKANQDLLASKEALNSDDVVEDDVEAAEAAEQEFLKQQERQNAEIESLMNHLVEKLDLEEEMSQRMIQAKEEENRILEELDKKRTEQERQRMLERTNNMLTLASATSSILGSIANMYEQDEEAAKRNAEKIKALRIAEATINTISGAIGAFMSAVSSIPAPYGIIVGAAQAASVTAAGMAQIAQIRNTSVTSPSSSASSQMNFSSASIQAPNIETGLQPVRAITTASEEERLNRMASEQKVYILQSDIEAAGDVAKVQVQESSF